MRELVHGSGPLKMMQPGLARTGVNRGSILRRHPLLYMGIGMLAMLALRTVLTMAINWWNTIWDDLHYGRPRSCQVGAVLGHNDSSSNPSRFIARNTHILLSMTGEAFARPPRRTLCRRTLAAAAWAIDTYSFDGAKPSWGVSLPGFLFITRPRLIR